MDLLEWKLADYYGVERAVCVASGLGALRLACIQFLDETVVRVPSYSCVALANAVLAVDDGYAQGVDGGPYDIAVNTFGVPQPGEINDATHGGAFSTPAIMSFGPTKLLAAGGGGVIFCGKDDADKFHDFRNYADKDANPYRLNDTMSDLHAAVALCQLKKMDAMIERRTWLGLRYNVELSEQVWSESYYRYVIQVENPGQFIKAMAQRAVEVKRPLELWNDCPGAKEQYARNVSLPCYPSLTEKDQDHVIQAVKECR